MIPAKRSEFWVRIFSIYGRMAMRRKFQKIRVHGYIPDDGRSMLVIANHFSWWDGFLMNRANEIALGKRFYVMMLETELRKNRILSRAGAFSVSKKSRTVAASLQYATLLLEDPRNMLLLFPQGKFGCMNLCPVSFENGWHRLVKGQENHIRLVFAAQIVNFFASRKPCCDIWITEAPVSSTNSAADAETDYNHFLLECIRKTEEAYA